MKVIELGSKVRCSITGFEGIATARVEYINGCFQYCVMPRIGTDGKMPEGIYLDVQQLEVIPGGIVIEQKETGGPQRDCPKH